MDEGLQGRNMTIIQQNLPFEVIAPPRSASGELSGAQDDLARLSVLLADAFGELLTSFSGVRSVARKAGSVPEIDQFTNRAIAALQRVDLASQLIGFTQDRLAQARESLKIRPQVPQTTLTNAVWAAGIATCADLAGTAPAEQNALSAGTIELF
jgi:hypothetical protein